MGPRCPAGARVDAGRAGARLWTAPARRTPVWTRRVRAAASAGRGSTDSWTMRAHGAPPRSMEQPQSAVQLPPAPVRGVLRPRQDDHRQVELAGVLQAVPGRRPDHPRRDAAVGVRPVRLPRRRRRPRPDGEDPRVHVAARRGLGRRDRQGDRRRDAAPRRRPDRVRRGRLAHGRAPARSVATSSSSPPAGPRWSSRSARCSAPTT